MIDFSKCQTATEIMEKIAAHNGIDMATLKILHVAKRKGIISEESFNKLFD